MEDKRKEFFNIKKEKMEYLKSHDSLTGMFNLTGLRKYTANLKLESFELLLIDIYGFKRINDYYGYSTGNKILVDFSNFLLKTIGSRGIIARDGSDEFILFLKKNSTVTYKYAEECYQIIAEYFKTVLNIPIRVACGVAPGSNDRTIDDIYSMAEDALYKQKESGQPGLMYYNAEIYQQHMKEYALSLDLHQAFKEKEFILYYQVQMDNKLEATGYEALVRWQHPTRGILSPGEFLNIIQKNNQVKKLDHYILERAFEVLEKWKKLSIDKTLSINLTTISFLDRNLIEYIRLLKEEYDVIIHNLCIEITEDYDVFKQDDFKDMMEMIRNEGIKVAIDDFGTGYASLSKIIKYNFDKIKIDKSLVDHIVDSEKDYIILKGVINIFTEIGTDIIVEGIETEAQLDCIKRIAALNYQGYYFGKPQPVLEEKCGSDYEHTNKLYR